MPVPINLSKSVIGNQVLKMKTTALRQKLATGNYSVPVQHTAQRVEQLGHKIDGRISDNIKRTFQSLGG